MKIKYLALLALAANMAHATVILTVGNAGGGLSNVLTNGSGVQTGLTVLGTVNGQTTNFTSTETLTAQGGQAKVDSLDAVLNSPLTFSIPGYSFTLIEFNPELTGATKPAGSVLTVNTIGAGPLGAENLSFTTTLANGENRFYLTASDGESIQSVTLSGGLGYSDMKQVRVGALSPIGGGGVGSPVPEPATFLMLGAGLLAVGFRRKVVA
ncbi:MAG TPA: PEP-CTERM sorting domain-containing protein [Bryobacteraceae bacterium]|nr:PEP-CTERM sorting domain-containing protein [Bryobacteraceae bacterium]